MDEIRWRCEGAAMFVWRWPLEALYKKHVRERPIFTDKSFMSEAKPKWLTFSHKTILPSYVLKYKHTPQTHSNLHLCNGRCLVAAHINMYHLWLNLTCDINTEDTFSSNLLYIQYVCNLHNHNHILYWTEFEDSGVWVRQINWITHL